MGRGDSTTRIGSRAPAEAPLIRRLAGIRLLRRERVPFHVISVLSQKSMEAPRELLDFYVAEGIEDVCFNVEESEGAHVSPSSRRG